MNKEYIVLSRAWYGSANLPDRGQQTGVQDEIQLLLSRTGVAAVQQACITLEWHRLFGGTTGFRLTVWDDAWFAFAAAPEVFAVLGLLATDPQPADVEKALVAAGFTDATALTAAEPAGDRT